MKRSELKKMIAQEYRAVLKEASYIGDEHAKVQTHLRDALSVLSKYEQAIKKSGLLNTHPQIYKPILQAIAAFRKATIS